MHGYGEFYDKVTEELYIGYFENSSKNGFGVLRNFAKNYIYVGQFILNKREGFARTFKDNLEIFATYEKDKEIKIDERKAEINKIINERFRNQLPYFLKTGKELKDYMDIERIRLN